MSSKVTRIIGKLGALDEFSETVRQLNSNIVLPESSGVFNHPWAVKPLSVSAQGAVNMASKIRASSGDSTIVEQYWKAGCMPALIESLRPGASTDRLHACVIALSALTDQCKNVELLDELVQLDTLPMLAKHCNNRSHPEGLRMACCSIAHSIIRKTSNYRDEFINAGGLAGLIDLLTFDPKHVEDEQYCQYRLERINDVRDYIEVTAGSLDEPLCKRFIAGGIREKLRVLSNQSNDNDIVEDANDVMSLLDAF